MLTMKLLLLHPCMIVLLSFWILLTTLYRRSLPLLRIIWLHFTTTHDDFDRYNMHVLDAPTCNYYEIGTTSPPLYVSNTKKLQETVYTMHWHLLCVHELFFYVMPIHRKRVRLCCCMIYVTFCSIIEYESLLIKIFFDIPWDPGGSITWALYV